MRTDRRYRIFTRRGDCERSRMSCTLGFLLFKVSVEHDVRIDPADGELALATITHA